MMLETAIQRLAHRLTERLDRECIGAWRAGYEYLVVVEPYPNIGEEPPAIFRRMHIPTDDPEDVHRRFDHRASQITAYRVGDLDREAVERFRGDG